MPPSAGLKITSLTLNDADVCHDRKRRANLFCSSTRESKTRAPIRAGRVSIAHRSAGRKQRREWNACSRFAGAISGVGWRRGRRLRRLFAPNFWLSEERETTTQDASLGGRGAHPTPDHYPRAATQKLIPLKQLPTLPSEPTIEVGSVGRILRAIYGCAQTPTGERRRSPPCS